MPTPKFKKGHKKKGGRQKGTKNKITNLKDSFLNVYETLGGDEKLAEWAGKNQINLGMFYKILSKMLPANMTIDGELNLTYLVSEKFMPKEKNGNIQP